MYDDDCYIINYFFGYKIKEDRVGFPINSINKVVNVLEDNHISYEIKNKKSIDFNNKKNNYLFLYSSLNNYYNSFKYCNNSKIRRYLNSFIV